MKLKSIVLIFATVLFGDVCEFKKVCTSGQNFTYTVPFSEDNKHVFDLNWLSEQLGQSLDGLVVTSSTCPEGTQDGDSFSFIPSANCDINIKYVKYTFSKSPDINKDGIVDDADLLLTLFNFGGECLCEDVDKNGRVADEDLMAVLLNFGGTGLGDVNKDNKVDDADLNAVLFAFGRPSVCDSDVNLDGIVEDADLLSVLFCFGKKEEEIDECRSTKKEEEECGITINVEIEKIENNGGSGGQGSTGSSGTQGGQGSVGQQGSQGQQTGTTGQSTGSAGDQGSTGSVGSEGSAGGQGATGSQGESGQTGSTGSNDDEVSVTCTETNFRPNIRTMDHNTRSVQRAAGAVLSYMNTTGPARRSRALRADIVNAQARIHNLFVANWTKMWESLPTTITQCTTNSDQVTCTTTSFSGVYSSILRNETRIIQTVQSLVNKYSSLYRNRAREAREIQRLLNQAKRAGALSANFIASLPLTSTVCSSL